MAELSLSDRLAGIVADAGLSASASRIHQLQVYLETLARWNKTINLTSLPLHQFPGSTLERLIAEPLRAVARIPRPVVGSWYDLGSGSGSPAIPMRIFLEGSALTMVESRGRKAAFLREVCAVAGLGDTRVLTVRIEDLPNEAPGECASLVTARAIRIDRAISQSLRSLVVPGSHLVLFGNTDLSELTWCQLERTFPDGMQLLSVPRGTLD